VSVELCRSKTGGFQFAHRRGVNVNTLISEPHEKCNTHSVSDALYPRHVEPTHAVWTSYEIIGPSHEIDCPIDEFWQASLVFLTQFRQPIFHAVRSPDGKTIYFVPVFTDVVWRGEC
jgi:hypothetical protein